MRTAMGSKAQWIVAGTLVIAALGVTLAVTASRNGSAAAEASGGGHDHGAMAAATESRPVRLDEGAGRRIGVTYATATVAPLSRTVRAVGTVVYDETRLVDVSPKISGWVERLHVDFTGAEVRRGQPLLQVYSPALVSAQEELILARRLADRAAPDSRAATNAGELLEAARRRLSYWDVPADEIRRIEESGLADKALVLRSPASGIVVEKNIVEGGQIGPGTAVFRIADLSRVWVEAEVFERDLVLLRLGQEARVTFEGFPGDAFRGRLTYVYPTVSLEARTGRVRLELANPGLRLKPGMYAEIRVDLPAIRERALQVPRAAVVKTGERSVVFVRHTDGTLVPHEVTTGLAAGDRVEILAGVEPGDQVVSSAAFLIDAESNLGAVMEGMETDSPKARGTPGSEHAGHEEADAASDRGAADVGRAGTTSAEDGSEHAGHPASRGG